MIEVYSVAGIKEDDTDNELSSIVHLNQTHEAEQDNLTFPEPNPFIKDSV